MPKKTATTPTANSEQDHANRDLTTRAMAVRSDSIDEATRSIEAVMSTEGVSQVLDWSRWQLIDEILVTKGAQFPAKKQAVLLDTHARYSTDDVIGSVREMRIDGENTVGRLYFAEGDDRAERAWQKVKQGHITDVSVGYRVMNYVDIPKGQTQTINGREFKANDAPLRVTTKWQIRELSVVPVGADSGAKIRTELAGVVPEPETQEKRKMPEDIKDKAPEITPVDVSAAERAAAERALKTEQERVDKIYALGGDDVDTALVARAIKERWDTERAAKEFMGNLRDKRTPPVEVGKDNREDQVRDIQTALEMRCDIPVADPKARERAEQFKGIGLRSMAAVFAEMYTGKRAPMDPVALWKIVTDRDHERAFSTASFPQILSDTANKKMIQAYQANPSTASRWMRKLQVSDFKTYKALALSGFAQMEQLANGGKFAHGALAEKYESYSVDTYGLMFGITRQMFINDDLGALTRIPAELGQTAVRNIDDVGYALLVSASGVGPTLTEDSTALFATSGHATANYATGTATVLADAGLTTAKKLMRLTKGIATAEGAGPVLNLTPRQLLIPAALERTAQGLLTSDAIIATGLASTSALTTDGNRNVWKGAVEPIVEPRLDAATNGTTAWYLISGQVDNVCLVYLAGNENPTLERVDPTDTLGIAWRVYHDIGAAVVDWRGIVRMKGAS